MTCDVVTLLSRRNMLRALGLGATLAACGADATTSGTPSVSSSASTAAGEIPDETAGPYPGGGSNGSDVLEQSGIVRSDIRSSIGEASGTDDGVPMTIELDIKDLANGGAAFAGVAVYVWHCGRDGGYFLYSDGMPVSPSPYGAPGHAGGRLPSGPDAPRTTIWTRSVGSHGSPLSVGFTHR